MFHTYTKSQVVWRINEECQAQMNKTTFNKELKEWARAGVVNSGPPLDD